MKPTPTGRDRDDRHGERRAGRAGPGGGAGRAAAARALPPRQPGAVARRRRADARRVARLSSRRARPGARDPRPGADRAAQDDGRRAPRPLLQPRAGGAARPGVRARPSTRSRSRAAASTRIEVTLDVARIDSLGEQDAGGAVPDRARGAPGGDPAWASVPRSTSRARRTCRERCDLVIRDDAPPSGGAASSRCSPSARAPSARTSARTRHRRNDRAAELRGQPTRRRLVFRAVDGDGAQQHLLFVWSPPATSCGARRRAAGHRRPGRGRGQQLRVTKLAPSPLPGDRRVCAYLAG